MVDGGERERERGGQCKCVNVCIYSGFITFTEKNERSENDRTWFPESNLFLGVIHRVPGPNGWEHLSKDRLLFESSSIEF